MEEKVDVASSYKQVVFFGAVPVSTTRRYNKPVAVQIKIKVKDAVSADSAPWIVLFNMNVFLTTATPGDTLTATLFYEREYTDVHHLPRLRPGRERPHR